MNQAVLALLLIVVIIWAILWLFQIGLWPFLAIFLGCLLLTTIMVSVEWFNRKN
jgi:hypothetical protein